MADTLCESCMNFFYDEEFEEYSCAIDMDEDDVMHLMSGRYSRCPYFRRGDDYTIVKRQN